MICLRRSAVLVAVLQEESQVKLGDSFWAAGYS